jgi:molybdate transport system permease protein
VSWQPLALSFQVATVATLLAGGLAVALAGLMARRRFPGADLLDALLTAPMVLPPTVLGYYLLVSLGDESAVGRAWHAVTGGSLVFNRTALVLAAGLTSFPFVLKSARAAIEGVDLRLIGAAQTLGASPLRTFFTVTLPLSAPGIAAGLMLGYARALGDFGLTYMIAGDQPGSTQTASLAIYDAWQADRGAEANAMAMVMAALAVVALWATVKLTRPRRHGF